MNGTELGELIEQKKVHVVTDTNLDVCDSEL